MECAHRSCRYRGVVRVSGPREVWAKTVRMHSPGQQFFWERAFGLDALSIHLEAISAVLFGTVKCLVGAPQ